MHKTSEVETKMKTGPALILTGLAITFSLSALTAQASAKRRITLNDLARLKDVSEPQVSPEGEWVAYTVETTDLEEDTKTSDIWMTRWDGSETVRLTSSKASESMPRWSPDGGYLAFLAARDEKEEKEAEEEERSQVWLLDRRGGEAVKLTDFPGSVSDFVWAPDSKRLALIASDPDPDAAAPKDGKKKRPRPIVIDRYQFKQDVTGYLTAKRKHLYLFDIAAKKAEQLTRGSFDDALPSWSPDGTRIAFASKRGEDPDRHDNWDVFVIDAAEGAARVERRLTTFEGTDSAPIWESAAVWSPDGRLIAYLRGSEPKWVDYEGPSLAIVPAAGGEARVLAADLDRHMGQPVWSSDGRSLFFTLEDDRSVYLARIPSGGGSVERLTPPGRVIQSYHQGGQSRLAALVGSGLEPFEVAAVEEGKLRMLTRHNADLMAELTLGAVEEMSFKSKDGTEIHGMLVKPPDFKTGVRYPTLLQIHGGPVAQDQHEFDFKAQLLAANGYLVVMPNYRGSSGRGFDFARVIYADWGHLEVEDVLAAIDKLVAEGLADPERLGIGGWSYGGMTTNYTISRDPRFKAAVSGAGISNMLTGYGTDQYIRQYENELGLPWKGLEPYLKVSHPFFYVDRIVTPTLFLCGERDFNVPLINSEQMYQALRSLGRDTQLVIYPDEYHGLKRPSFLRDRLERSVAWYDRYLKSDPATAGRPSTPGR
jgi:dipeptidyl aminopeptidase/acylaminoacyl peptidase